MPGSLEGVRVIDLTDPRGFLAGKILADMGADVIKLEPPGGDPARCRGPFLGGVADPERSLLWLALNTSKRGITLDLAAERGRELYRALIETADVVLESFAPGELAARGLGYETLREAHPQLVHCAITPFGQTGPYSDWIATDATLEALGGMQFSAGLPEKPPLLPPGTPAYDIAGLMGALAAMSALFQCGRNGGHGQVIDLSALEALAQQTTWSLSTASVRRAKGAAGAPGGATPSIVPEFGQ